MNFGFPKLLWETPFQVCISPRFATSCDTKIFKKCKDKRGKKNDRLRNEESYLCFFSAYETQQSAFHLDQIEALIFLIYDVNTEVFIHLMLNISCHKHSRGGSSFYIDQHPNKFWVWNLNLKPFIVEHKACWGSHLNFEPHKYSN